MAYAETIFVTHATRSGSPPRSAHELSPSVTGRSHSATPSGTV